MMAISPQAKKIGLRLVQMADGSAGLVTDSGEILKGQFETALNSRPGEPATVTVSFVTGKNGVSLEVNESPQTEQEVQEALNQPEKDFRKEVNDRFNERSESWVVGECEAFEADRRVGYANLLTAIMKSIQGAFTKKGE